MTAAIGGFCTGIIGLAGPVSHWNGLWVGAICHIPRREPVAAAHAVAGGVAEIVGAPLTLAQAIREAIFGPCVVTGGMFGGAFGYGAAYLFPSAVPHPGTYAIVGMIAFFAAAAKAPISTIIMISEMTGGYGLLGPAMFAVVTAFILSGKRTIFPAQVNSRLDSPFHADEFEPIALRRVTAGGDDSPAGLHQCHRAAQRGDEFDGRLWSGQPAGGGAVTGCPDGLRCWPSIRVPEKERQTAPVKQVMLMESAAAFPDEDLFTILKRFAARNVGNLPVVTREKPDCPIGLVTRSGLWEALETAKEQHRTAGGHGAKGNRVAMTAASRRERSRQRAWRGRASNSVSQLRLRR